MHKKSVALALALALLAAAALLGLRLMTGRMQDARMDKAVYVTATPVPAEDDEGVYEY